MSWNPPPPPPPPAGRGPPAPPPPPGGLSSQQQQSHSSNFSTSSRTINDHSPPPGVQQQRHHNPASHFAPPPPMVQGMPQPPSQCHRPPSAVPSTAPSSFAPPPPPPTSSNNTSHTSRYPGDAYPLQQQQPQNPSYQPPPPPKPPTQQFSQLQMSHHPPPPPQAPTNMNSRYPVPPPPQQHPQPQPQNQMTYGAAAPPPPPNQSQNRYPAPPPPALAPASSLSYPSESSTSNHSSSPAPAPPPLSVKQSPQPLMTTYTPIPASRSSHMPADLAAICQPLCDDDTTKASIIAQDCGNDPPPKCSSCQAYVNLYFQNDVCNFCGRRNKLRSNIPVSAQSTVEYIVRGPYCTRTPTPVQPIVVYALDMTIPKFLEEALPLFIETVLPNLPMEIKVGIAWVGARGIFLKHTSSESEFVCMPDLTEQPYCPLPLQEWVHSSPAACSEWMKQNNPLISRLLHHNGREFTTKQGQRGYGVSPGGAALAFLADALQETGGRGILYTWRRPNYGIGALRNRLPKVNQFSKTVSTQDNAFLYTSLSTHPQSRLDKNAEDAAAAQFYKQLAEQCIKAQAAIDVVLQIDPNVPSSCIDTSTLGHVCQVTNGRLRVVSKTIDISWQHALQYALVPPRVSGWDCVLKIRTSSGWQVKQVVNTIGVVRDDDILGAGSKDTLDMSVVCSDTTFAIELQHAIGGFKQTNQAYLQSALLYTNPTTGQRLLRVSTIVVPVASTPSTVDWNLPALTCLWLKQTAMHLQKVEHDEALDTARVQAKHMLLDKSISLVAHSPQQFFVPHLAKHLDACAMLRGGGKIQADDRALFISTALSCNPSTAIPLVYPYIYNAASGPIAPIPPSQVNLDDDTLVLLMDTVVKVYIWIGSDVSPNVVQKIEEWYTQHNQSTAADTSVQPSAQFDPARVESILDQYCTAGSALQIAKATNRPLAEEFLSFVVTGSQDPNFFRNFDLKVQDKAGVHIE